MHQVHRPHAGLLTRPRVTAAAVFAATCLSLAGGNTEAGGAPAILKGGGLSYGLTTQQHALRSTGMTRPMTWGRLCAALVLAAALIIVGALAGCGGGSGGPDVNPTAAVVVAAPGISTSPASVSVEIGQAAVFTVQATGSDPLSYQWQRDGKDIPGAVAASYALLAVAAADSGAGFRVVVTNAGGSVTSNAATLTVNSSVVAAPSITAQPQGVTVLDGSTAVFAVAVSSSTDLNYQWQRNGADITGAVSSSYTTPTLTLADNGASFTVIVSNAGGAVTSTAAGISVNARPPTISTAPLAVSATAGQTASFSVTADGTAPLNYQWQRNGADIPGATAASYTTPSLLAADSGAQYRVVVSNAANAVTSVAATLTITPALTAPSITSGPQPVSITAGQTASFNVTSAGTAPLRYQWLRDGTAIVGATSATYSTPATTLADNGANYSVRVSNSAGTVASGSALLSVSAPTSNLSSRAWTKGQLIGAESGYAQGGSAIDDQGVVTVLFTKGDGTRPHLYATRGTPRAAGADPTWTTPQALDDAAPIFGSPAVAVARNGDAVAAWVGSAACTATTYKTTGICNYLVAARFSAAANAWEAPKFVLDFPGPAAVEVGRLRMNPTGDIMIRYLAANAGIPNGVAWKPSASSSYQHQADSSQLGYTYAASADMDDAGNMLLVSMVPQTANNLNNNDLVAYRGTQAAGFGPGIALESSSATATLVRVGVGSGGQQVVLWSQNNGTTQTLYAATSASPTASFDTTDIGVVKGGGTGLGNGSWVNISDAGQVSVFDVDNWLRLNWSNGVWASSWRKLPGQTCSGPLFAPNRNADFLLICAGDNGRWGTYDGVNNVWVVNPTSATTGLLLGAPLYSGYFRSPLLSNGGQGVAFVYAPYDVLPTNQAPAGSGRNNVYNLWSAILK